MSWLTEHSIWVLLALIIFMAVWFVAFFARNHQAKDNHDNQWMSDVKHSGTAPLKKSGVTPIKESDKV